MTIHAQCTMAHRKLHQAANDVSNRPAEVHAQRLLLLLVLLLLHGQEEADTPLGAERGSWGAHTFTNTPLVPIC